MSSKPTESLEEVEREAEESLRKGEYVQACEKYYKISEEIVKTLSEYFAPKIMEEVSKRVKRGSTPWISPLLNKAVDEILVNIGWRDTEYESILRDGWRAAVTSHREGFHDFELTPNDILHEVRKVRAMIGLAKKVLRNMVIQQGPK